MNKRTTKVIYLIVHITFASIFLILGTSALIYATRSMCYRDQWPVIRFWSRVFEGLAGTAVIIIGIFHLFGLFRDIKKGGDKNAS